MSERRSEWATASLRQEEGYVSETLVPAVALLTIPFFVGYHLCRPMVPAQTVWCLDGVCHVMSAYQVVVVAWALGRRPSPELVAMALNVLWVAATRLMVGDALLGLGGVFQNALLLCCTLSCGACLVGPRRDLLLRLVTLGTSLVLLAWAVLALATATVGHSVLGVGGIAMRVELAEPDPSLAYVQLFGVHRITSCAIYACVTGMVLYQAERGGRLPWRAYAAVFVPVAYLAMAVQHGRSGWGALAITLGLAAATAFGCQQVGASAKSLVRKALAALLVAVVVFCGFGLASDGLMRVTRGMRDGGQQAVVQVVDGRDTLADARSVTGRTGIWAAALPALCEHRRILLTGQPQGTMMAVIDERMPHHIAHMHNALLQQLMLTGLPGLLLHVAFLACLLARSLRCLTCPGSGEGRTRCLLAATLLGIMAYGMVEPLLWVSTRVTSMLFCLVAGIFVAEDRFVTRECSPGDESSRDKGRGTRPRTPPCRRRWRGCSVCRGHRAGR